MCVFVCYHASGRKGVWRLEGPGSVRYNSLAAGGIHPLQSTLTCDAAVVMAWAVGVLASVTVSVDGDRDVVVVGN